METEVRQPEQIKAWIIDYAGQKNPKKVVIGTYGDAIDAADDDLFFSVLGPYEFTIAVKAVSRFKT
jgi:hypothetical protein